MKSIIVYKSITVANRAKKLLGEKNILSDVIQLSAVYKIKGCSYALSVDKKDFERAVEISKRNGLRIRAHFINSKVESGVYFEEGKK